ncbi:MAG TPA: hypothetical protein VF765_19610 [Polyangiaceae bacterium]
MKPATAGRVAAATFAAEMLFPILHQALGGRYTGFTHVHDVTIDTGLAVIWGASAIAGLVQRPDRAFFVMLAGTAVTFIHFVMFSLSTGIRGPYAVSLPFLALFPLQAWLVVRSAPAFFARKPAAEHEHHETARAIWARLRLRHG